MLPAYLLALTHSHSETLIRHMDAAKVICQQPHKQSMEKMKRAQNFSEVLKVVTRARKNPELYSEKQENKKHWKWIHRGCAVSIPELHNQSE